MAYLGLLIIMDKKKEKRNKAEQFRKSKQNFFRRAYKIGVKSDTEIFILMKRKGRTYTFTNTNTPSWPSQAQIVRNIIKDRSTT
jgi:hypothetical protein